MKTNLNTKKTAPEADADAPGTQDRILLAAEELFIQQGYDGVSINDVAVRANVAKGLVFYYFKNKDNLFETVLDRYYSEQAMALMSSVGSTGTARERIHAGIDAYLDFVEKHPGYPRLIQREICSGPRDFRKIIQYMVPLQQWGESVFGGSLPAEGPFSPRHFFMTIFGMAINYYTYSPVLEGLWGKDPMAASALAERRIHIHAVIDKLLEGFLDGEASH